MTCENWKYLEVSKLNFTILSKDAENLLEELCQKWNETKDDNERLNILNCILSEKAAGSEIKRNELIGLIKELEKANCIQFICLPDSGRTYWILDNILMSIKTYRKRLEEHKAFLREVNASNVTNIDNSTHNNLNVGNGNNNKFGNVDFSGSNNNKN